MLLRKVSSLLFLVLLVFFGFWFTREDFHDATETQYIIRPSRLQSFTSADNAAPFYNSSTANFFAPILVLDPLTDSEVEQLKRSGAPFEVFGGSVVLTPGKVESDYVAAANSNINAFLSAEELTGQDFEINLSSGLLVVALDTERPSLPFSLGDVIVSVDGQNVENKLELGEVLVSKKNVKIRLLSGDTFTASVKDGKLGVALQEYKTARLPVQLDFFNIAGSSFSLAASLGYLEAFFAGDLSSGRTVVASGSVVDDMGTVKPIEYVALKLELLSSGTIFFVHESQVEVVEAAAAERGVTVVGVLTVEDAASYLCQTSTDEYCTLL